MSKKRKKANRKLRSSIVASQEVEERHGLNAWQLNFIFACVALAVAAYLHLSVDRFPDPDAFYHFRHAAIYGSMGNIFQTSFPWVLYSVVNKFSSDLWYGFHLLLVPFTFAGDPVLGMQLAGAFVTILFLALTFTSCVALKIKFAIFWPFFLLFSSAFMLHRLGMLRPQVLSLGLGILIFALLATENVWGLFLASLALVFLHLNLFFIPFLILAVFALTKFIEERSLPWREGLALTGGVLVGWLLRPNPLGAAKILYVQLIQFTLERLGGNLLDVGAELAPLRLKSNSNYLPFILLLLASLLYIGWRYSRTDFTLSVRERTNLISAVASAIGFFFLSVFFARRAFDLCSVFGVILLGLVFSRWLYEAWWARVVLICAFVFLVPYSLSLRNQVLAEGWDSARFQSAAKWIADNSNPRDIVFNARWEYFPELFFWNTKNVYVSGMDPVFQFAYDPVLYAKGYNLVADDKTDQSGQDPYNIIKEDFHARYVVLAKPFDDSLYFRLQGDNRFQLRQENDRSAVFEVN
jgi:hypothetical protein